jgi:BolA protein
MGPLEERIKAKIEDSLAPERLEVINESHLHAGHQGGAMDGSGETHFRVRIVSKSFDGMSRVERHRTLNQLLADELTGGVHALALEPAAPGEKVRW